MKTWRPEEIKKFRASLKLTQPILGSYLGVSGNYVYLLEKGVKTPSKTLKLLLDCIEKEKKKRR